MEEYLSQEFYGNTISQWLIASAYVLGALIAGKILYWFISRVVKRLTAKTETKLDDLLIDMLEKPIVFAVILAGIYVGLEQLNKSIDVASWIDHVYTSLITLNVTWILSRVIAAMLTEYVEPLTQKTASDLDDQLFPVMKKGIRWIIWIIGIIVALNNAGYDVGALIAGLGIGGLALAMAAKDSVSNIFGGFTIFTDKPFKIGERVRINGYDGIVTEIGLRSFRLRTLDGTEVIIPNSKATDSIVENVSREPARKITSVLGLEYNTTPSQLQQAMDILKKLIAENQEVEDNSIISFTSFGDFSLGITLIYYIKKESDIYKTQSDINLSILTKFNEAGLEFAFPTQTINLKK